MSEPAGTETRRRAGAIPRLWLVLAVAVAGIVAANAHLLYVATTSQPACVTHIQPGKGNAERGLFSAAQSSCSLPTVSAAIQR